MIEVSVWTLFDIFGDSVELRDIVKLINKYGFSVYMSGKAVYIDVEGKLVRLTWKDGDYRGWRDVNDIMRNIEDVLIDEE